MCIHQFSLTHSERVSSAEMVLEASTTYRPRSRAAPPLCRSHSERPARPTRSSTAALRPQRSSSQDVAQRSPTMQWQSCTRTRVHHVLGGSFDGPRASAAGAQRRGTVQQIRILILGTCGSVLIFCLAANCTSVSSVLATFIAACAQGNGSYGARQGTAITRSGLELADQA